MPALPVIADPENVRVLIEARTGTLFEPTKPPTSAANPQGTATPTNGQVQGSTMTANPQVTATPGSDPPAPIKWPKPDFSEPFKDLAFIGDDKLNALCKRVSVSIWGRQSRRCRTIGCRMTIGCFWRLYHLDLFVGISFRAPTPVAISHANRTSTSTTGAISPAHTAGTTPQHPGTAHTRKIIYDPAKPLIVNTARQRDLRVPQILGRSVGSVLWKSD